MATIRQVQVQNRLVEEISDMIRRDLRDPRLAFVTVTAAEVTRDLQHAKVYISVIGDEALRNDAVKSLQKAAGWIRGEFTRRAHLRVAPEIEFRADEGIEQGARVIEILSALDIPPEEPPA